MKTPQICVYIILLMCLCGIVEYQCDCKADKNTDSLIFIEFKVICHRLSSKWTISLYISVVFIWQTEGRGLWVRACLHHRVFIAVYCFRHDVNKYTLTRNPYSDATETASKVCFCSVKDTRQRQLNNTYYT